jgi:hypothetical protein
MAVIRRISPGSAFKVGAVVYAVIGFVALLLMLPVLAYISPRTDGTATGFSTVLFRPGLLSIIIMPIIYGIFGGFFSMLAALVYNLAAGWIGGLEVDLS